MHINNCLDGDFVEVYGEGNTTVLRGKHKGREVAVKMLRLYLTSNLERCIKASITALCVVEPLTDTGTTEILPRGCCMETPPAPEHTTIAGYGSGVRKVSVRPGIRMDGSRQHQ